MLKMQESLMKSMKFDHEDGES